MNGFETIMSSPAGFGSVLLHGIFITLSSLTGFLKTPQGLA
jgi:hypothetical protein